MHSEEVKPLGGIDDTGLLRVQGQPQTCHDPLHSLKPELWVLAADDLLIVTVADQLRAARLWVSVDVNGV